MLLHTFRLWKRSAFVDALVWLFVVFSKNFAPSWVTTDYSGDANGPFEAILPSNCALCDVVDDDKEKYSQRPGVQRRVAFFCLAPGPLEQSQEKPNYEKQSDKTEAERNL